MLTIVCSIVTDLVKKRMMVAELGGRGQSGSPINGEIACGGMSGGRDSYMSQHDVLLSPLSPSSMSGSEYYGHPHHGGGGGGPPGSEQAAAAAAAAAAHLKRKELFTQRKQREFIPDNKKDDNYWDRRRRNNEAAKRSREKRRFNDMVLEQRVVELTKENHVLKAQLEAIKEEYGICGESVVCVEKVLATLPTSDQVLSMTKRPKLAIGPGCDGGGGGGGSGGVGGPVSGGTLMLAAAAAASISAAIPTPVIHQPIHGVVSPPPRGLSPHSQSHVHAEPSGYEPPEYHHHHHSHHLHSHGHTPYAVHPYHHAYQQEAVSLAGYEQNALNLSSRSRARSPYDVSSGSGSGAEDETPPRAPPSASPPPAPVNTTAVASAVDNSNNSLPLKLRHKSHLGDKDQAASALLALHNIKQEPVVVVANGGVSQRASSTPPWDGEGSSDERDSGISLGAEWPTHATHDNKQRLHSEIVRLSTEVANLKSLVIRTNN